MRDSIETSYRHCIKVAKKSARNFHFAFMTLPRPRYRAMCVLYAYMRVTDDIADQAGVAPETRRMKLEDWRADLLNAHAGEESTHPVLPALVEVANKYDIEPELLLAVIDGVASDLTPREIKTFEELSDYCYLVAGVVGLCCLKIWECRDPAAKHMAIDCGLAFQLTNILRDLKEDARLGRVYLPTEDLERFDIGLEQLLSSDASPGFHELMRFQTERARHYYHKSAPLFDLLDNTARPIFRAMVRIYSGLLKKIEADPAGVQRRRVSLSWPHKCGIMLDGFLRPKAKLPTWFQDPEADEALKSSASRTSNKPVPNNVEPAA